MVSASVLVGSWVAQKPDSWVAIFVAAGTDVIGGLLIWSLTFLSRPPLDSRLGPGLHLSPVSPVLHTPTPGFPVCRKDLPGVGDDFSELQVTLANVLEAKEWSARASDALSQYPIKDFYKWIYADLKEISVNPLGHFFSFTFIICAHCISSKHSRTVATAPLSQTHTPGELVVIKRCHS